MAAGSQNNSGRDSRQTGTGRAIWMYVPARPGTDPYPRCRAARATAVIPRRRLPCAHPDPTVSAGLCLPDRLRRTRPRRPAAGRARHGRHHRGLRRRPPDAAGRGGGHPGGSDVRHRGGAAPLRGAARGVARHPGAPADARPAGPARGGPAGPAVAGRDRPARPGGRSASGARPARHRGHPRPPGPGHRARRPDGEPGAGDQDQPGVRSGRTGSGSGPRPPGRRAPCRHCRGRTWSAPGCPRRSRAPWAGR